jgi:hypothetical protein
VSRVGVDYVEFPIPGRPGMVRFVSSGASDWLEALAQWERSQRRSSVEAPKAPRKPKRDWLAPGRLP